MTLTKADIVEAVAKQNRYKVNRSFEVIEILLEIIKSSLESGQDVQISGFGKFCVKEKKERREESQHWRSHDAGCKKNYHFQMLTEVKR